MSDYRIKSDDTGIYDLVVKNIIVLEGYRTADVVPKITLIEGDEIALPKKFLGFF